MTSFSFQSTNKPFNRMCQLSLIANMPSVFSQPYSHSKNYLSVNHHNIYTFSFMSVNHHCIYTVSFQATNKSFNKAICQPIIIDTFSFQPINKTFSKAVCQSTIIATIRSALCLSTIITYIPLVFSQPINHSTKQNVGQP